MKRKPSERLLIKKIRSEITKINRRFENIKKNKLPTNAEEFFKTRTDKYGQKFYDTGIKDKTEKELKTLYRRLKEFSERKTSYVSGAKKYKINYDTITRIENLNDKESKKFWSIYDKFTEGKWLDEQLRYEVKEIIEQYAKKKYYGEKRILQKLDKLMDEYEKSDYKRDVFGDFIKMDLYNDIFTSE